MGNDMSMGYMNTSCTVPMQALHEQFLGWIDSKTDVTSPLQQQTAVSQQQKLYI